MDHFREEEILSRAAFAEVARQFRDTGQVDPAALLAATTRYVESLDAQGVQVAVLDALLPFIPSLLAWGYDDAAGGEFVADLSERLRDRPLVLLYVDGAPERAIARAVRRENPAWLTWLIDRYQGVRGDQPVRDEPSLCRHLHRRRRLTLELLAEYGWDIVTLDSDTSSAEELLTAATTALMRRDLGRVAQPPAP